VAVLATSVCVRAGQSPAPPADSAAVPDAPAPQIPVAAALMNTKPCSEPKKPDGTATQIAASTTNGAKPDPPVARQADTAPCKMTWAKRYDRFVDGPHDKPLTPKDKAWLAVRNVADPINNLTILATSAIAVGSDSHSDYGPGMAGWGKNVGVNFTQGLTGEFVGTFLICSVAHQDPHYHRVPNAGIMRRIGHGILQVVWTQGDNGKGMLNYANLWGLPSKTKSATSMFRGGKPTPQRRPSATEPPSRSPPSAISSPSSSPTWPVIFTCRTSLSKESSTRWRGRKAPGNHNPHRANPCPHDEPGHADVCLSLVNSP